MDGARNENDVLTFGKQRLGLGRGGDARVGQTALDVTEMVEAAKGVGSGNGSDDEGTTFRGTSKFIDADAIGGVRQELAIGDDLRPIEELAVGADFVMEEGFGGGNRIGNGASEDRDR